MSSTAKIALAVLLLPSLAARAAPPPVTPIVDPPARVGRLAGLAGTVSFHTAGQTAWSPAQANIPVTSGDAIWTEPGARAALDVAGNRLWLDGRTLLEVAALDDHAVRATETQGTLYVHLRALPAGDVYSVQTPRGLVQLLASGRYEIAAGVDGEPTRVTVLDGAAQVLTPGQTLDIGPMTTVTLTGAGTEADPVRGVLAPAQRDAFVTAILALERPATTHQAVSRMTGGEDLENTGTWQDRPAYGAVWYPPVDPGWVPYRHGRWSWVAPWGWTWVDEAPWGFAPFHYGRWVQDDGRWGWTPAPAYVVQPTYVIEPVYAPALVSFLAIGVVAYGAGAGSERSVGWVPLGPNEPYYPPYRAGLPYIQNLNRGTVQNARTIINDNSVHTNIYNRTVIQTFVNQGGATVAPVSAVAASRAVAPAALAAVVATAALSRAQAGSQPGFVPTAATLGVTPAVARQFNFTPVAPAAAPGPALAARSPLPGQAQAAIVGGVAAPVAGLAAGPGGNGASVPGRNATPALPADSAAVTPPAPGPAIARTGSAAATAAPIAGFNVPAVVAGPAKSVPGGLATDAAPGPGSTGAVAPSGRVAGSPVSAGTAAPVPARSPAVTAATKAPAADELPGARSNGPASTPGRAPEPLTKPTTVAPPVAVAPVLGNGIRPAQTQSAPVRPPAQSLQSLPPVPMRNAAEPGIVDPRSTMHAPVQTPDPRPTSPPRAMPPAAVDPGVASRAPAERSAPPPLQPFQPAPPRLQVPPPPPRPQMAPPPQVFRAPPPAPMPPAPMSSAPPPPRPQMAPPPQVFRAPPPAPMPSAPMPSAPPPPRPQMAQPQPVFQPPPAQARPAPPPARPAPADDPRRHPPRPG